MNKPAPGSRGVILMVDDTESIRLVLGDILRGLGFTVIEAADGMAGVAQFKRIIADELPIKLVLTDLNMPRMDGVELIRSIREQDKRVPILMVTTNSDATKRQEGKQAGANGWLVKPVGMESLVAVVNRFTQGSP